MTSFFSQHITSPLKRTHPITLVIFDDSNQRHDGPAAGTWRAHTLAHIESVRLIGKVELPSFCRTPFLYVWEKNAFSCLIREKRAEIRNRSGRRVANDQPLTLYNSINFYLLCRSSYIDLYNYCFCSRLDKASPCQTCTYPRTRLSLWLYFFTLCRLKNKEPLCPTGSSSSWLYSFFRALGLWKEWKLLFHCQLKSWSIQWTENRLHCFSIQFKIETQKKVWNGGEGQGRLGRA